MIIKIKYTSFYKTINNYLEDLDTLRHNGKYMILFYISFKIFKIFFRMLNTCIQQHNMSRDMRFPTMWYVRHQTAHTHGLIRAFASRLNS